MKKFVESSIKAVSGGLIYFSNGLEHVRPTLNFEDDVFVILIFAVNSSLFTLATSIS